jgi:glutathione synthase
MALKVAVQMDHISGIRIAGDSTFALMLEAQRRGHALFHYTPGRLAMRAGVVTAYVESVEVRDVEGDHFTLGPAAPTDLATMDVVLLRQDPPFDMGYITTTHMLERIHPATLVVNDPAHVRNAPEKVFVTEFPDLMPETLVTRNPNAIRDFRNEFGDIILKPLYGNGGAAVFRLREDDENLSALLELFLERFREPFVVQRYLPAVRQGDKRIILVDGEAAGAVNRVPAMGDARSNMHVGGKAVPTELTERDREICARIGPELKRRGFLFVGIDVIGGYLTEINVTSPTGIREVKRFGGADIAALFWDAVEGRRRRTGGAEETSVEPSAPKGSGPDGAPS